MLGGGESFHGHAEVGAERRSRGVEACEKVPLQCAGKEALGQIFGVLITLAEFDADEAVNWFPIKRAHAFQSFVWQRGARTRGFQERKLGRRKRPCGPPIVVSGSNRELQSMLPTDGNLLSWRRRKFLFTNPYNCLAAGVGDS